MRNTNLSKHTQALVLAITMSAGIASPLTADAAITLPSACEYLQNTMCCEPQSLLDYVRSLFR